MDGMPVSDVMDCNCNYAETKSQETFPATKFTQDKVRKKRKMIEMQLNFPVSKEWSWILYYTMYI